MTSETAIRISYFVPSSNVMMDREIAGSPRGLGDVRAERFSFHLARVRMKSKRTRFGGRDSEGCATELSNVRINVLGFSFSAAMTAMGKLYHRVARSIAWSNGGERRGGFCRYLSGCIGRLSQGREGALHCYRRAQPLFEIQDNLAIGARNPPALVDICKKLDIEGTDTVVLFVSVQMPSSCVQRPGRRRNARAISFSKRQQC